MTRRAPISSLVGVATRTQIDRRDPTQFSRTSSLSLQLFASKGASLRVTHNLFRRSSESSFDTSTRSKIVSRQNETVVSNSPSARRAIGQAIRRGEEVAWIVISKNSSISGAFRARSFRASCFESAVSTRKSCLIAPQKSRSMSAANCTILNEVVTAPVVHCARPKRSMRSAMASCGADPLGAIAFPHEVRESRQRASRA